jgi:hypothetical protein
MSDKDITSAAEEVEIDLGLLSDEDLVEFEAVLTADYEAKRNTEELGVEDVEDLTAIKEAIEEVRAEMQKRVELAESDDVVAQVQGDSFLAKVAARKAATAGIVDEEEVAPAAEADVAKAEAVAPIVITPKDIKGDVKEDTKRSTGIVAAAGSRRFAPGTELPDLGAVAELFTERRPEVRGTDKGTDGSRYLVASVRGEYDESRVLGDDSNINMARISAVTSQEAITASGGMCAPLTPYYSLTVYGDAHRPVRDSLPVFKAERGGIRFMPPPRVTDLVGSTRRTTNAQDAAGYTNQTPAGSTAPKPSLHVTCESEQTSIVQAVSRSLTFGNMGARTYPEQVEAWLKLGLSEFSRYTETELLNAISLASTALTAQQLLGSTYALLDQVSLITTSFRSRHRLSSNVKLRVLMPFWATEIIRADIAAQAVGDGLSRYAVSDAQIMDWFSARGANVTFFQDTTTAAGAPFTDPVGAGVLESWPNFIEWFIFPEGSFLYLDGGSLDLGLVRDSTLNSQNDYQIFYEEFFGLTFIGLESFKVTSSVCPNGVTSGPTTSIRTCASIGS